MTTSTRERRQQIVDETNAKLHAIGIELDAETLGLQQRYIDREVTAQDLLDWVLALARELDFSGNDSPPVSRGFH